MRITPQTAVFHQPPGREGGFALIVTLLAVVLIVAVTLEIGTSARSRVHGAANLADGMRLGHVARSGVEIAMAVLFEDARTTRWDSLREIWADPAALTAGAAGLFTDARIDLAILDHSGRLQVNLLVDERGNYRPGPRAMLRRLLGAREFGLDPEAADSLVDAVKDWIDPDDQITGFGAESGYYLSLKQARGCRNGPLRSLDELLMVRGVSPELFYGTREHPGISRYLTVYGDGRVNINTADPLILCAMSEEITRPLAERMAAYRNAAGGLLGDPLWYRGVPGIEDITLSPEWVTTSSTHFEIVATASLDRLESRVAALVERGGGTIALLSWKRE